MKNFNGLEKRIRQLLATKKTDKAFDVLKDNIGNFIDNDKFWYLFGEVLILLQRFIEAERAFHIAYELNKTFDNLTAWGKGLILMVDIQKGIEVLNEILKISPNTNFAKWGKFFFEMLEYKVETKDTEKDEKILAAVDILQNYYKIPVLELIIKNEEAKDKLRELRDIEFEIAYKFQDKGVLEYLKEKTDINEC